MEFGLSEDQRQFGDALRRFLTNHVSMELRRTGDDKALWAGLTELGVPGVLVPEGSGGAGLGMLDAALVAEALGQHAAPTPFLGTAVLAPVALRDTAHLTDIAAGRMRVAAGLGALTGSTGVCTLRRDGDRLSGTTTGLLDAAGATHLLLALPDRALALVAADAPGVTLQPRPSLDRLRPLADLDLAAAPTEWLAADAAHVLDAGRVVLAAETLGAAQSMLDQAVAYANQRRQFGRSIASFQGVKHACAELAAWLEPCRAFVWYAAQAQDARDPEAHMLACQVKAHLDEVGREVARHATEVHGGMGFTELLGLPFWFKRIAANRQLLGGPERCREDAAAAQGLAA